MTDVTGKPHEVVKGGARQRLFPLLATACLDMPASVVVSSILINLLSLFMPLAIMQVYDRIIPRQAVETLTVLVIVITLTITAEAILQDCKKSCCQLVCDSPGLANPSRSSQTGHGCAFIVPGNRIRQPEP